MKLSNQAMGAIMMALQKTGELMVTNPPTFNLGEIPDDFDQDQVEKINTTGSD